MSDLDDIVAGLKELASDNETKANELLAQARHFNEIIASLGGSPRLTKAKTYAQRRAVKAKAKDILKTPPWEAEEGKTIGSLPVSARKKRVGPKRKYTKKAAFWTKKRKAKK